MSHLQPSTQLAINAFLTATSNLSCDEATYEAFSEAVSDFSEFEQACMYLEIA